MSSTAMEISCPGIHGRDVGRFVKIALKRPRAVDVIFIPGMGAVRESEAYEFWQNIKVWFNNWTTFYTGQDCHHTYKENIPLRLTQTLNCGSCKQSPQTYLPIPSLLQYSILFYSILFYSILFYSILFYSILLYSGMLLSGVGCLV